MVGLFLNVSWLYQIIFVYLFYSDKQCFMTLWMALSTIAME